MKLSFFGGTLTVTGSKYLLEDGGKRYLIDCGLFQGKKELRLRNWEPFPIDPKTIDTVLITHAHLDHTGYLPLLVNKGFKGKILASKPTKELSEIILKDSGRLQEEAAELANKEGFSKHHPAKPLYTEEDAIRALGHFQVVKMNNEFALNGLRCIFEPSGHILGSSFITIKNNDTSILFSGDIGRFNDPVMKPPVQLEGSDYLVLESTYGDREHPQIDILNLLEEIINTTTSQGGSVVIPSFAVARAQSVLYYISKLKEQKRISDLIPIYLDSPMAQDATDLWCNYSDNHALTRQECQNACHLAKYTTTSEDSKMINRSNMPSIIISASGMAEGGRVLHHIRHYGPNPANTILFVGYQAEGTRGERILKGEKEVKIYGKMVPIRARVENITALSSHADYKEMLNWLKGFKKAPKKVFITHGEVASALAFKKKIEETLGWEAVVPSYLDSFEL